MATDIKGPGIFLAQFAGDAAPYNSFDAITKWAGSLGYKGVQVPTWDGRLFDLAKAASSKTYCDEIKGIAKKNGVEITELSTHLQGHLVAINPAYDAAVDAFAPANVHGNPKARQEWACEQVMLAAKASKNLGITRQVSFTGALAWPFLYPWPPRAPGVIEEAFKELGKRWKPLLNAMSDNGVKVGFELHPGEDTFDGATFEMFLEQTGNMKPAASITIPRTSCCSSSTILSSSTSITNASSPIT
jgi:sugar phosphate isomerase/epimerase